MTRFSYAETTVAPQYHCGQCGIHGVKLWREYSTFLNHQSLLCADCSCKEQAASHDKHGSGQTYSVDQGEGGEVWVTTLYDKERDPRLYQFYGGSSRDGDQIGWRVPAVPTENGTTYWGYTSVPPDGVAWWNRLPLRLA